jgi:excisionase family DNA binding protein
MSVSCAAAALGIGRTKLYELLATGEVRSIRLGRRRLVVKQDLEQLITNGLADARQNTASPRPANRA